MNQAKKGLEERIENFILKKIKKNHQMKLKKFTKIGYCMNLASLIQWIIQVIF